MSILQVTTSITRLLTGFLILLLALPLFSIWRLALLLLFCTEYLLQLSPIPTVPLYPRAHALFLRSWTSFLKHPFLTPILTYKVRIICSSLILSGTIIALTISAKVSLLFIPWWWAGKHTRAELLLHLTLYIAASAPLASMVGVGVAVLYYAGTFYKYGKFEKEMRRRPGGKGYWKDPSDEDNGKKKKKKKKKKRKGSEGGGGGGEAAERSARDRGGTADNVAKRTTILTDAIELRVDRWSGDTLLDAGTTRDTQQEVVQRPEPAANRQSRAIPKTGVTSPWALKNRLINGYDGRQTRREPWETDVEMKEQNPRV